MRKLTLCFLLFASPVVFSSAANAQRACKEGTRATLTGTIQKIDRGEPEPGERVWIITPQGTPAGACAVKQLWGRGLPPGGCTSGKGFSASGKVVDAESLVLLNVDSVTCK